MKQSIRPFENVFSVVALILFSQGFFTVILGVGSFPDKGNVESPLLRIVFLLIYLLTFALLAFRLERTIKFINSHLWIVFLFGMAGFSVLWSVVPDVALRKTISLIGSSAFGLYLGSRFSFKEQLRIYGWVYGISIFFSIFFALILKDYGIMNSEAIVGAWRGIYPHKNGLGQSMFAAFLTFYFLANSYPKKRTIFIMGCLLSIITIYFAESATALISVIFIFALGESLKKLSFKSKTSVFLILLFVLLSCLVLFLVIANFTAFLSANEKDITLSGRTPMWDTLWDFIRERPLLGYGYESFFANTSRPARLLWQKHTWFPVHSHNGYVHTWINLGIISLATLLIGYFGCWFRSLYKYLASKDIKMLWIFLFLTYTIFFNLTEVSFLSTNSNIWIMSLACIYSLKVTTPTK